MQKNAAPSANDSIASRPSGRHLNFESQAETEADDNIRMLADFIKQGKQGKNSETVSYVDLPNTALAESGSFSFVNAAVSQQMLSHTSHFIISSNLHKNRNDKHGAT